MAKEKIIIVACGRESKTITSTIDENLIESFGQIYSGQISINNLFSHSQCSNGVKGCTSVCKWINFKNTGQFEILNGRESYRLIY